ncbi:MAG TPA: hypothetical protein VNU45_12885 [Rummeliibacillus sp.]|nr:hypothetical protein [Rummeliibacillus sp.]
MKYEVIKDFMDLEDENHIYRAGDKYPRKGRLKKERADELVSEANKIGVPLIMPVEEGDE